MPHNQQRETTTRKETASQSTAKNYLHPHQQKEGYDLLRPLNSGVSPKQSPTLANGRQDTFSTTREHRFTSSSMIPLWRSVMVEPFNLVRSRSKAETLDPVLGAFHIIIIFQWKPRFNQKSLQLKARHPSRATVNLRHRLQPRASPFNSALVSSHVKPESD